jgi:hypothetical protein
VSNGGKFKLYAVLNSLLFPAPDFICTRDTVDHLFNL